MSAKSGSQRSTSKVSRRKRIKRRYPTRDIIKYPCGCVIQSSKQCDAFLVCLCDFHTGKINTTSSVPQIENKIERDAADRYPSLYAN